MKKMLLVLLLTALAAWAGDPELPELPGLWLPVVGKGAVYTVTGPEETVDLSTAIVAQDAGGGYWLEEVVTGPKGVLVVKALFGKEGVEKLILQPPGKPPKLLPPLPGRPEPKGGSEDDVSQKGKLIGPESLTTPAGTFQTMHYQADDETHVWVTRDLPPLGVVKCTKGELTFTLKAVLSDAKSQITSEPTKL